MPPLEGEVAAGRRGSGLAIGLAAGKLPGIVCIQTAIPLSAEAFRSEKLEPLSQLRCQLPLQGSLCRLNSSYRSRPKRPSSVSLREPAPPKGKLLSPGGVYTKYGHLSLYKTTKKECQFLPKSA